MSRAMILFDVDGTLLLTGGASSRCIHRAAAMTLGRDDTHCPLTAGRLDHQLFEEICAHVGVEVNEEQIAKYKRTYLDELSAELKAHARDAIVLPGARSLIESLSKRDEVIVGILTGNFLRATLLKLAAAGLRRELFKVISAAEDGTNRSDLVHAARAMYTRLKGEEIRGSNIVIIGDTPRDIECARETGCLVIAVATGQYSVEQLSEKNPDCTVRTLDDRIEVDSVISRAIDV